MSSDDVVISVKNLSKRFEIYDHPSDRLKQFLLPRIQRFIGKAPRQYFREFWALNNVSFDIRRGETVGIIGRNGSGKSTLLQMICGTLTPTSGSIETAGRVAALLELGSGFNPEFTGRENIYMNASVMGLTSDQIDARYNDIVLFADIGDFLDQPVKTYSSGMLVRLAFAVIAHVDADILVVDEALAVGDIVFTQKCMRFIRNFQLHGSLIFVSHDIGAVQSLCEKALWLSHGNTDGIAKAKIVCEKYLEFTNQQVNGETIKLKSINPIDEKNHDLNSVIDYESTNIAVNNLKDSKGWETGDAYIDQVKLNKIGGDGSELFEGNEVVRLTINGHANIKLSNPIVGFLVKDRLGQDLFGENTFVTTADNKIIIEQGETFQSTFEFLMPMLPNGQYSVMASIADGNLESHIQHHWLHDALIINVSSSKVRYGLVGIPYKKVTLKVNEKI